MAVSWASYPSGTQYGNPDIQYFQGSWGSTMKSRIENEADIKNVWLELRNEDTLVASNKYIKQNYSLLSTGYYRYVSSSSTGFDWPIYPGRWRAQIEVDYWDEANNVLRNDESSHIYWTVVKPPVPTPTISPPAANASKSGVVVSGAGLDSSISRTEVYSSPDGGVSFALLGNATQSIPNWTITDNAKAPAPGTPQITLSVINGDEVRITWLSVAQPSISRSYKARAIDTSGRISSYSGTQGSVLIPSITKYTIERLISGQTTWAKIGEKAAGDTLAFTDTTLPMSTAADYRVTAYNSQGTLSGTSIKRLTVVPPPIPTFSSLTVVNNDTFRLSGSGAIVVT